MWRAVLLIAGQPIFRSPLSALFSWPLSAPSSECWPSTNCRSPIILCSMWKALPNAHPSTDFSCVSRPRIRNSKWARPKRSSNSSTPKRWPKLRNRTPLTNVRGSADSARYRTARVAALGFLILLTACRRDMQDQPRGHRPIPDPDRQGGYRTWPEPIQRVLHALPRTPRRRHRNGLFTWFSAASVVLFGPAGACSTGTFLRCDLQWLRRHAKLRLPRSVRRSLAHRGVHPRLAIERVRERERRTSGSATESDRGAAAAHSRNFGGGLGSPRSNSVTPSDTLRPQMDRVQRNALFVGLAALVISGIGAFADPTHFWQSYLFAYIFWAGLTLGCVGIFFLHNVVGGNWGVAVRRLVEAGLKTLPLILLLAIPIFFALGTLYKWTDASYRAEHFAVGHKAA